MCGAYSKIVQISRNFVAKCNRQLIATKIKPASCSSCSQSHTYSYVVGGGQLWTFSSTWQWTSVNAYFYTLHISSGVLATQSQILQLYLQPYRGYAFDVTRPRDHADHHIEWQKVYHNDCASACSRPFRSHGKSCCTVGCTNRHEEGTNLS